MSHLLSTSKHSPWLALVVLKIPKKLQIIVIHLNILIAKLPVKIHQVAVPKTPLYMNHTLLQSTITSHFLVYKIYHTNSTRKIYNGTKSISNQFISSQCCYWQKSITCTHRVHKQVGSPLHNLQLLLPNMCKLHQNTKTFYHISSLTQPQNCLHSYNKTVY